MEIKKVLKGFKPSEVRKILDKSRLTLEEYTVAVGAFLEKNYREKTCK